MKFDFAQASSFVRSTVSPLARAEQVRFGSQLSFTLNSYVIWLFGLFEITEKVKQEEK